MKTILTLTLNPTIDRNTHLRQVVPERKLRCARPGLEPGGGGINVSRAIRRLGGGSTAMYVAGGPTGDMLHHLLEQEGLTQSSISVSDWTRENLIVFEEISGQQFRFGMPGPELTEAEWQHCLDVLEDFEPAPDYLVASGSLAPGIPDDFYARIATVAKERGARLVVDTSGAALKHATEAGAYLLKPNHGELQDMAGGAELTETEQIEAARDLILNKGTSVVVISLGAGGAFLVTKDICEHIRSPTVPIRSKVGAGDSMVAGTVLGLARGMAIGDAVRLGVAAGAAAVMTEGTELCRREDTERLYEELQNDLVAA